MASVNSAGEVTALTKGNAVITAEVNGESVTCTVTVKDESDAPDDGSTTTKPDDGSTTTKPDNSNKPSTGTTKVTNYSYTPIYTVSEVETADGYRRVVRIDKTVEAWEENYLDKVSQSAKESMVYALERIEARINPPVEEKKK